MLESMKGTADVPLLMRSLFILTISTTLGSCQGYNKFFLAPSPPAQMNLPIYRNSSDIIPVNILIKPLKELDRKIYVPTGVDISATAEILDEKFRNTTITYQWSVKNETITTDPKASKISYRFNSADDNNYLKVFVLHKPNETGTCQKDIIVRDPISIFDPSGKLFLEHGELLDITIRFNGTGPFKYCEQFCHLERGRGCEECSPDIWTKNNHVNIVKYLRSVGNYTLRFVVDNYASRQAKSYSVKIFDTIRHQSTPIVPIVCSISAVLILLTGVLLHSKFNNTIPSETADFDFTRDSNFMEDEEFSFMDEEQSFFQRARSVLFNCRQSSMVDSHMSESRSRLF